MMRDHGFAVGRCGITTVILVLAALNYVLPCSARGAEPDTGDPAAAERRLLSGIRQLTFEGRRAGEGYFDHSGQRMVFQSEREAGNPFFQIYVLDLRTGDSRRVSPGHGKTTCGWMYPDGRRVLFASTHEDPDAVDKQKQELADRAEGKQRRYAWDYDEFYDLFVKDLENGTLKNLTKVVGYDAEGSVSPDGRLIVFASNRHAYGQPLPPEDARAFEIDKSFMLDIYLMNSDGTDVRRLTDVRGYDGGPFFSPDGQRICWRRFSEDGATAEIYTMKIDGNDQRRITDMGAMSWAPFFHPSGEYLVFNTNKHGFENFELYVVDAEGRRQPQRVTHTPGFDGLPSFSPDGTLLTWTSNRAASKESQIFLAAWNHQEARRLLELQQTAAPLPDTEPPILADDAREHVVRLASEEMEGRMTGENGERLATEYVASLFKRFGLQPAGDAGTYFQKFEFTGGVSLGPRNELQVHDSGTEGTVTFKVDQDWRPLTFSKTGRFEPAEVVFAGYGIVAPKTEEFEDYDSYVHLDVQDKWVMVLRFVPEDVSPQLRQHLHRHASARYKAMVARDRGARGLIMVSGPNSKVRRQLIKLGFDATLSGTSLPVISVTDAVGNALVQRTERSLKDVQSELDGGEMVMGFAIPGTRLGASIDIEMETKQGRNVLGRLPASGAAAGAPAVIIGAHVDHLGRGDSSNSLAGDEDKNDIHYGADDNASGVAGLLEIAEFLAHEVQAGLLQLKRDVWFAAWSGEELGLLGSAHFVNSLAEQTGGDDLRPAFAAYLNMDMIGRLDNRLILQGVGSSSIWKQEIERRNVPIGLPITLQNDSYLPTDATSFYLKKVPILSLFTDLHGEYHTPRDTPDLVNYQGLQKVARLAGMVARSLASRDEVPDYLPMEKPEELAPRAGLRAYLGTIPDYGSGEVPGLKLSGVAEGGPAAQAGVKGGDVIVELAGRKIENIYDYTFAIDALKIGEPVEVAVIRDGRRMTLSIVPASRE